MPRSDSSCSSGRSSSPVNRLSWLLSSVSLDNPHVRRLPYFWQLGGTVISVSGYIGGTNSVVDVAAHIAVLSFITGIYLSLVIRDHREPQDSLAITGYIAYAVGLGLVSAPSLYTVGVWEVPLRALGLVLLGGLLSITWYLFTLYLHDEADDEREKSP